MAKHAFASRPKASQDKRLYGLATIKAGTERIKVTFLDSEDSFKFDIDDLPKKPHGPKIKPETEEDFMVVLSKDGDGIDHIAPVEGHFLAKFIDIERPEEDADPAPIHVEKEYQGKDTSYDKFTALFKIIQDGRWKDTIQKHFLRYRFEDDGNGFVRYDGDLDNPKAVHVPRLDEFCVKVGVGEEPIAWPEDGNILPEILRRGLKANKVVDLIYSKGYIAAINAADYEEPDDDDEDGASKPAPKKNAKAGLHKKQEAKREVGSDEDL